MKGFSHEFTCLDVCMAYSLLVHITHILEIEEALNYELKASYYYLRNNIICSSSIYVLFNLKAFFLEKR